jgi:predicted ATP-dependent Lon-type protease
MVPFIERNYNLVELGPRGTGKSHLFQQISPYAHLISGGKATVARMFVNMASGQRGLVCQYDVICFDEPVSPSTPRLPPNTVQRVVDLALGPRRAREPTGRAGNLPRRPASFSWASFCAASVT